MKRKYLLAIHMLVLLSLVGACGFGGDSGNSAQDATLEAISAAVRGTATVEAAVQENPNAPVETAQAEATARSLD